MIPLRDNIPTTKRPVVTLALIVANVVVYFFWQRGGLSWGSPTGQHFQCQLQDYGAIPYEFRHLGTQVVFDRSCGVPTASTWVTPFTAMFMHGGLLHLGGNMLFLWIFGNNIEDSMGRVKYVVFYLLGGLAAFALQFVSDTSSTVPTLGASGAIAAVLGGYLLLYPRARVVTLIFIVFFFTILELPALVVLGVWFIEQAYAVAISSQGQGGVAYFAHVGGFIFGLVAVKAFAHRKPPPRARVQWHR